MKSSLDYAQLLGMIIALEQLDAKSSLNSDESVVRLWMQQQIQLLKEK